MHKAFSFKTWMARNWTTILIAFVLISSFAYRYSSQKKKAKEDLFFKDEIYSKWFKEPKNNEYFTELNRILDRNKELHKVFDGAIAQKLIEIGESEKVKAYSKVPLKCLSNEFPNHAIFVENSILIAEKKYEKALGKAYDLNDKIGSQGGLLKIYNLLRISLLEKMLDNPQAEHAALIELKQLLQKDTKKLNPEEVEVLDYLNKRVKFLKN